jgi:LPS-assembly lipoprotein
VLLALLLGACGFRPLYSRSSDLDTVPQMAAVQIEPARNRLGLQVRNGLIDALGAGAETANPLYVLSFNTFETPSAVLVTQRETVTRYSLSVVTTYALRDSETGESLLSGAVTSIAAYNVLRAEYANLVAEEDARKRAALDAADQIRVRLALYFRDQAEAVREGRPPDRK